MHHAYFPPFGTFPRNLCPLHRMMYVQAELSTVFRVIYKGRIFSSLNSFLEIIFCLFINLGASRIFIIPGTHIQWTPPALLVVSMFDPSLRVQFL